METRNVQAPNRPINPLTLVSLSTARPYDEPTPPYQNGGRPQEQEAPIAAAARYQTLIDNLPSMLYRCTLDKAGTALFVSAGSEALTGYVATDFVPDRRCTLADLVAPEDRERVAQQLQQAIRHCHAYNLEYRIVDANGVQRWVADRGRVIVPESNDAGWRDGLLVDISEQKATEAILSKVNKELVEGSRHTGEFLANVSHEIRTPLSVMLTIAESLQEGIYGAATPRQGEALSRLRRSGRHLLGLVNDILDMAKMEAGKLTLQTTRVMVETVCTHTLQMVQELAKNKGITLSYTNDDNLEWLWADEQRLRQILVNLLSNSIKFTPEGGAVGLTVRGDASQEALYLTVWDTGIGIADEETAKIFHPFIQLDTKLSRPYEGTGLGLPLVYRLTRLHDGGLTVESTEGEGSRFTLALPWHEAETTAVDLLPAPVSGPLPLRVLALTTDTTAAQQLANGLRPYAIEVTATAEVRNATMLAGQQPPDLLLIEAPLPDYSLLESVHQLRMSTPAPAPPLLVLTTIQTPGQQPLWQQISPTATLVRPISFKRLAARIQTYCQ
jgi:PAS domain S-box-containing protein